jgi:hypothetical protein
MKLTSPANDIVNTPGFPLGGWVADSELLVGEPLDALTDCVPPACAEPPVGSGAVG